MTYLSDLLSHLDAEKKRLFKTVATEWILQKQRETIEKMDITKYQTLPQTYQLLDARKNFTNQLLEELRKA